MAGPDYRFVRHLFYKGTNQTMIGNFKMQQKLNEFSKYTKSFTSRTMNNLKESLTIMKAIEEQD